MGKQRVRCPRDERVARSSAMIHLLPVAPWIMAVFACHVSMLPTTPPKIRDGQGIRPEDAQEAALLVPGGVSHHAGAAREDPALGPQASRRAELPDLAARAGPHGRGLLRRRRIR